MGDIRIKIDAALAKVFSRFFCGMPEFSEDEEPDEYAVYFVMEKPERFASGTYTAKKYWVSVSIISRHYNQSLYDRTEVAFSADGFTYSSGTDVGRFESGGTYPHRYQYTQDYIISAER